MQAANITRFKRLKRGHSAIENNSNINDFIISTTNTSNSNQQQHFVSNDTSYHKQKTLRHATLCHIKICHVTKYQSQKWRIHQHIKTLSNLKQLDQLTQLNHIKLTDKTLQATPHSRMTQ